MNRPKSRKLRRWLFRIHTWLALGIGLYIVVISVSGSAVVFRREVSLWMIPRAVPSIEGVALTEASLREAVERVYAGYEVLDIVEQRRPESPVAVRLTRNGRRTERLFDPYAATDMGSSYPGLVRAVECFVDLHDNLLAGSTGRKINGAAGIVVTLISLTGLYIWWPGRRRWKEGLIVKPSSGRRLSRQLHSAMGFWSFALLLIWALTAVYFAFPSPLEALIDRMDPDPNDFERPGEAPLLFLIRLHFGRFGGLGVRVLWVILGLIPAAMFVTGFMMWWRRSVRRAVGKQRAS